MAETIWQSFADRIAYDGALRVACEPAAEDLDGPALAHLNDLNGSVLAAIGALGERCAETTEDEGNLGAELARLDAKLDVLMEIVNRTLFPDARLPSLRQVRLNAYGIRIDGLQLPEPRTRVRVRIHFDACRGLPLDLPGRGVAAPAAGPGFIAFEGLTEGVRSGIERLVFRHHRRLIAESRQGHR